MTLGISDHFFPVSGYMIPETTLGELAEFICQKLHIDGTRIVGNPNMIVRKVGLTAHFSGDDTDCLLEIAREGFDVILPLETVDWTIISYAMDASVLGRPMGLINAGHFNVEEIGMESMQGWISEAVDSEVPIQFIRSGNMYHWIGKK